MPRVLSLDLETYSSVSLKDCGVYRYSESPDFEIQLLSASYDGGPVECYQLAAGDALPDQLIRDLTDPTITKEAHNAQFERVCLSRYLYGNDKFLDPNQWVCTMAHAKSVGLPASLDQAGTAIGLDADDQKLKTGKSLIQYFAKPHTSKTKGTYKNEPWSDWERWNLYTTYNEQDVRTELALEAKINETKLPRCDFEPDVYALDQRINDRGALLDLDFITPIYEWYAAYQAANKEKAIALTGMANPNSRTQIIQWLQEQGEDVTSTKEEVLLELRESTGNPDVIEFLDLYMEMNKSSLAKYDKMLECVCEDGRARGTLQYYGARTGRWAGKLIQFQNIPRLYLDDIDICRKLIKAKDFENLQVLHDSIPDTLKQLIRTAIVAPEGKTLVVCDYSAIEARVIAWIAQQEWRLEAFRNHKDIYCESASMIYGVPVEKHGVNGHLRAKGKIAELALGYQGWIGAMKRMGGEDAGLSESEMKDIILKWREASPKIVELWKNMETCAELALTGRLQAQIPTANIRFYKRDGSLYVQLPSGRSIAYRDMTVTKTAKKRNFKFRGTEQGKKNWGTVETYGGKLTENITQAIARDCLAFAMLRLEKAGYDIVFHVHDEVIIECDEATAAEDYEEIKRIMSEPLDWAPGLILTAEGFISKYYKKD